MIKLIGVSKKFHRGSHEVVALNGVDLAVGQGEFLSVMGPSGSGKSTMLHIMGAMDKPTSGKVLFKDKDMAAMSDDELSLTRRREMGFVFQFFNLMPTLTVAENIALPLLLDGKSLNNVQKAVKEVLGLVGLGGRDKHLPTEVSGGEMQRVAIARGLVNKPSLLFADEPTGNLDSVTGLSILNLLKSFQEQLGQTIVMVTHDARAAAYGDRIITLRDGVVEENKPGGGNHVSFTQIG